MLNARIIQDGIIGYSPNTGHCEPGWATAMGLNEACDLGQWFKQDAIYYVQKDKLYVSYCDKRRGLVPIGPFTERLHVPPERLP